MRRPLRTLLLVAVPVVLAFAAPAGAQQPARAHVAVPTIVPHPEDVSTLDGVINAYYDGISRPIGAPRQWSRDRTFYIPGMRFVAMSMLGNQQPAAEIMTHQEFVDATDSVFVRHGFFEKEIIASRSGSATSSTSSALTNRGTRPTVQ